MENLPLILAGGVLLILVFFWLWKGNGSETTTTVISASEDPVASQEFAFQANVVGEIIKLFNFAWGADPDDIAITQPTQLDWSITLYSVAYQDYLVRLYNDVSRKETVITYLCGDIDTNKNYRYIFKWNRDFNELMAWVVKITRKITIHRVGTDAGKQVAIALKCAMESVQEQTEEEVVQSALKAWEQLPLDPKHINRDMDNLVSISAYIIMNHPKEFLSVLQKIKGAEEETKEEIKEETPEAHE